MSDFIVKTDSIVGPHFFRYGGLCHMDRTEVKFKNDFLIANGCNPEYNFGRFGQGNMSNGNNIFFFFKKNKNGSYDWMGNKGKPYIVIKDWEIDNAVEEIVKDYPMVFLGYQKKKDYENTEVCVGWVIYIFALIFSVVFKGFIVAWVFETIWFFVWRFQKLYS